MAQFETAGSIIQDVAIELGLATTVPDAMGSTDPNIIQLWTLLKRVGRRLTLDNEWLQFRKDFTIALNSADTTVPGSYALPDGFLDFVDGTLWNRTTQRQLVPVSPQQWSALLAITTTSSLHMNFRLHSGALQVYPDAASGRVDLVARIRYWVSTTVDGGLASDAPATNDDVVRIDEHLVSRGLKLAFLSAKSMDTTAALDDYEEAFNAVKASNLGSAPPLSLNGCRPGFRLISAFNVPDTGYGA